MVVVVVEGVVVVVVVGGTVVVVVVVGGTVVVVVVVGGIAGISGMVVVVVVVGSVVVVVVVVSVVDGTVVDGTVVDGTVVVGPVAAGVPAAATLCPVGVVMVTAVQAPATCIVAMSATIWVRDWRSAASADASLSVAKVTALVAASRPEMEAFTANAADWARAIKSLAAMLRYCWATTPSASRGGGRFDAAAEIRDRVARVQPVVHVLLNRKTPEGADAASNWACADERWISAVASPCWRVRQSALVRCRRGDVYWVRA